MGVSILVGETSTKRLNPPPCGREVLKRAPQAALRPLRYSKNLKIHHTQPQTAGQRNHPKVPETFSRHRSAGTTMAALQYPTRTKSALPTHSTHCIYADHSSSHLAHLQPICSCQPHSAHSPLTEHDAWHTCCSARCPHTGTSLPRQGPGPILDLFSHFYDICGTIRSRLRRRGDSVKKEEIYYRILNLL